MDKGRMGFAAGKLAELAQDPLRGEVRQNRSRRNSAMKIATDGNK